MRKSFALILASLLVGVVSAAMVAQTHDNMNEKKVTDEVTLQSDLMVAGTRLKAGRYQIACDSKTIRFSVIEERAGTILTTKVLEVPCNGKKMDARRGSTELSMPSNKDGLRYLERLYLRGSDIEHVFPAQ